MKKLDYITILRACAILGVLCIHVKLESRGTLYIHPYLTALMDNGARGVQLFYLLSAFTLFRSFNKRQAGEAEPMVNYFIRRFFRIAPLYYLAILYYLWQNGTGPRYWLGDAPHITPSNVLSNVFFLHGFNPYWITSLVPGGWSIAVEVLFYVFLPFLAHKLTNIQRAYNFLLMSLLIRTALLLFFTHHVLISDSRLWQQYLTLYFPSQLPIFALGILLYFLVEDKAGLKLSPKSLLAGAFLLLVGISLGEDLVVPGICYFGLAFVMLALSMQAYRPVIFFNLVFRSLGKISYTIYLTHPAAIFLLNRFSLLNFLVVHNEPLAIINYLCNYVLVLCISAGMSAIIYPLIEAPMQRVGKTWIEKRERKYLISNC